MFLRSFLPGPRACSPLSDSMLSSHPAHNVPECADHSPNGNAMSRASEHVDVVDVYWDVHDSLEGQCQIRNSSMIPQRMASNLQEHVK